MKNGMGLFFCALLLTGCSEREAAEPEDHLLRTHQEALERAQAVEDDLRQRIDQLDQALERNEQP